MKVQAIKLYKSGGLWMFDDARRGLRREPFVRGASEMIEALAAGIPNAAKGFTMRFADRRFPGWQARVDYVRGDENGWSLYRLAQRRELSAALQPMEAWLCPSLGKFFADAPRQLYVACHLSR